MNYVYCTSYDIIYISSKRNIGNILERIYCTTQYIKNNETSPLLLQKALAWISYIYAIPNTLTKKVFFFPILHEVLLLMNNV